MSRPAKYPKLEHQFQQHVAPKFPTLKYDPTCEITSPLSVPMDQPTTVYRDSVSGLRIVAHKRQTWVLDDYDVFIKCDFFVGENNVYTIKDY